MLIILCLIYSRSQSSGEMECENVPVSVFYIYMCMLLENINYIEYMCKRVLDVHPLLR